MSELVFDDVVEGTTATYTDPSWNEAMGVPDAVIVSFLAAQVSGTTPTLTINVESSNDQVNWQAFADAVSAVSLSTTVKTSGGSDAGWTTNGARYMRLKIQLGGTDPAARLQIWWIGRDFALAST